MKIELGALDTLPRDRGIRVTVGENRIAVFRVADEVFAIGDLCSHAEASLAEGEVYGTDVECPRHGSEFDLRTGEPISLPATRPVPVYEVKVEDGNVYLFLEDQ
jgi:3-phenylpropionate/trans-cinnamate dioxygenase ferredoxin subunit